MDLAIAMLSSDLLGGALTIALVAGGLLLAGALVSLAVFAYRSVKGDGMREPRRPGPETPADDDDVTEGGPNDEWDYY